MKNKKSFIILFLGLLFISDQAFPDPAWAVFPPNTRIYEKDNILCEARKRKNVTHPSYHFIRVGNPDHPYRGVPELTIRLSNDDSIELRNLTVEILRSAYNNADIYDAKPPWPSGAKLVTAGYYTVIFHSGKVISFEVIEKNYGGTFRGATPAAIKLSESSGFMELPFSESQTILIFGKPNSLRDVLRE